MARFSTLLALVVCIGSAAMAEPDLSSEDPFIQFWDNIVRHPFAGWGDGTTWGDMMESMTLGGYVRARYETTEIEMIQRIFGPSVTGPTPNLPAVGDDWADWVAYKALLTTELKLTPDITFYGSLINMNVIGENARFHRVTPGGPRVGDAQIYDPELALYEGYMQWENLFMPGVTGKVGRQELAYGNQWLLSNNSFYGGLSFDAAKLAVNVSEVFSADFFAGQVNSMFSPDGPSRPRICGMYATYLADVGMGEGKEILLDVYVLHNTDNINPNDIGAEVDFARERRYTVGSRMAGYFLPDVDYSLQAAYQFGRTAARNTAVLIPPSVVVTKSAHVQAYAGEAELGKTWDDAEWTPRVAVRAAYASGDNNLADKDVDAFNPLYRDPHGMNGLADVVRFTNLLDYALIITAKPYPTWIIGAEGHILRTAERLGPTQVPPTHVSKRLGKELDLFVKIQATDNLAVTAACGLFVQGDAFRDITGNREHDERVYLNFEYSF